MDGLIKHITSIRFNKLAYEGDIPSLHLYTKDILFHHLTKM